MPEVAVEKPVTLDMLVQPSERNLGSATSDMPVIETKPDVQVEEQIEEAAPVEETGKTPLESATKDEGNEGTAATQGGKKNTPKGVQKRLDELAAAREEQRRRAEAAEGRLDRVLAALERQTGQPAAQTKAAIEAEDPEPLKPNRQQFPDTDTYEQALSDYVDARSSWVGRREAKAVIAETQRQQMEAAQRRAQEQVQTTYRERIEKAHEKYPDYSEVAENPNVAISVPMAQAIMATDDGPDIAYFLGKNPAAAQRIAVLPVPYQLMELGRISAGLKAPASVPKQQISGAPAPVRATRPSPTVSVNPENESMEEYAARRSREEKEARAQRR